MAWQPQYDRMLPTHRTYPIHTTGSCSTRASGYLPTNMPSESRYRLALGEPAGVLWRQPTTRHVVLPKHT
ncbi:MAG: hypothetical protein HC837_10180 [Chloroflexaceae bacterium]|nr:hypothetical protein [Chloroflexaceae bacterium]